MKNDASFWNKMARKYARSPVKDVASWDETLKRSRGYLDADDRVLEIGAGTGSTAFRMHDAVSHYRATDISDEMMVIASEKLSAHDAQNLEFAQGTVANEPREAYDAVLAYNLLHLVDDVSKTAGEVHETLKPGGVFISKSACISGKYAVIRLPVWVMQKFGKAPFLNAFSPQKLREDITRAGFEIVEMDNLPKGSMIYLVIARKI